MPSNNTYKKNDERMKKWINYISHHSFLDEIFTNNIVQITSLTVTLKLDGKLLQLESN